MGPVAQADGNADRQLCQFGGSVRENGKLNRKSSTDGGRANGMPRKLFVPLAVIPMNVPLSRVTSGQVQVLSVGAEAKTLAAAIQTGISNARRKTMSTREEDGQTAREIAG